MAICACVMALGLPVGPWAWRWASSIFVGICAGHVHPAHTLRDFSLLQKNWFSARAMGIGRDPCRTGLGPQALGHGPAVGLKLMCWNCMPQTLPNVSVLQTYIFYRTERPPYSNDVNCKST